MYGYGYPGYNDGGSWAWIIIIVIIIFFILFWNNGNNNNNNNCGFNGNKYC